MKIKYYLFLLITGLAISVTVNSQTTFAADGLFGPIIYSQVTPGSYTWTVPAGVNYVHMTAMGGGNFFGSKIPRLGINYMWNNVIVAGNLVGIQELDHVDMAVTPGDTYAIAIGQKEVSGTGYVEPTWIKQYDPISDSYGATIMSSSGSTQNVSFPNYSLAKPSDYPSSGRNGFAVIESTESPQKTFYIPGTYKVCYVSGAACDLIIPAGDFTVQVWGAGGGGGNSLAGSGTSDSGAGGGGGYTQKTFSGLTPGTTFTAIVGAGGTGGIYNSPFSPGLDGATSTFSTSPNPGNCLTSNDLCTTGGGGGTTSNRATGGGTGGIGRNGDININGNPGVSSGGYGYYGGLSGKPSCVPPMYIGDCSGGSQKNQANYSSTYYMPPHSNYVGSDNFKWESVVDTNSYVDYSGGDGYSPGNGGANGVGMSEGGSGGDGMIVIKYGLPSSLPPNVPTNLIAVQKNCGTNSIDLSWSMVTGASSYKVYQNGVVVSTIGQPSSGNIASTTESSLETGGGYEYEVSSIVSGVESATSTPPVYQFAPSSCFDYSLSNPGTTVQLGLGASLQVPVTVHKLSGEDSDIGLTLSISGIHTGTSGTLSPTTVHLTSSDAISQATMSALFSAIQGTFNVTVSGSATDENGAAVLRSTTFPVQVGNTSASLTGTCTANGSYSDITSPAPLDVTYLASASGGTSPYSWDGGVTHSVTHTSIVHVDTTQSSRVTYTVSDSVGSQMVVSCPLVTITNSPGNPVTGDIDLRAFRVTEVPFLTGTTTLRISLGSPAYLGWMTSLDKSTAFDGYICSGDANKAGQSSWNSATWSISPTYDDQLPSESSASDVSPASSRLPAGRYTFQIVCTKNVTVGVFESLLSQIGLVNLAKSSQPPIVSNIVNLIVTSSSAEEI